MKHFSKFCLFAVLMAAFPFANTFSQQDDMAEKARKDRARGIWLPENHKEWWASPKIESYPDEDYLHASEAAHEAFRDIKFSIRIHWGVYVIDELNESQGWMRLPNNEKRQAYLEEYKLFNPTEFNAQEWMDLFKRSGIECMAFTTKHCDGFSMFRTKTRVKQRVNFLNPENPIEPCDLAYSIEETPFKRDIVKELCDAAHKNKIKIDFYFSHIDWYDANFRPQQNHPLGTPKYFSNPKQYCAYGEWPPRLSAPDPTSEETAQMLARHHDQLLELVSNYGKIDMMCFDCDLSLDVWPEMKKTIKEIRQIQPDIMLRNRGIKNYGDYYTPERVVPENKENTNMPWMVIYPLTEKWSYDSDASHYKGTPWIVHNIIDCAAKGGSFMVGTGPDKTGKFHPEAIRQLEETGKWLKVNGEGIYKTRAREVWKENEVYFTRTKDHKKVFAFVEKWPGTEIVIPSVNPKKGSKIYLFGHKKPLKWSQTDKGVKIEIPEALQSPENRPCDYAWGFKIEVK